MTPNILKRVLANSLFKITPLKIVLDYNMFPLGLC